MDHLEIMKILPWYVNRTLGKEERQAVERHLEHCGSCIWEVEELRLIKASVVDLNSEVPRPSRDLWRKALAQIQRGEDGTVPSMPRAAVAGPVESAPEARNPSFWDRVRAKLVGEPGMGWARFTPALALVLLVIVGIQNLISIPRLRAEMATLASPSAIRYQVIPPQARSETQKSVEMGPDQPFLFLEIDVNPPEDVPLPARFLIEVGTGDGSNPSLHFTVKADTHLLLRLPTEGLNPGPHTMIVKDAQRPHDGRPLGKYRFQLRFTGGDS